MLQHADINVGPKAYTNFKGALLITRIFTTIQGEGPFAGSPAIFVRLAGCNRGAKAGMGCEFCDTNFHFDEGRVVMLANLIFEIEELVRGFNYKPLIVFTGGEPMLQANLVPLIKFLLVAGFSIQVESNGDRILPGFPAGKVSLVVSPKAQSNGYRPLNAKVLAGMSHLKFLIEDNPSSSYYDVPDYARLRASRVFVQPMTSYLRSPRSPAAAWEAGVIDPEMTARNHHRAAELALKYGYRVSMQTHLWLGVE